MIHPEVRRSVRPRHLVVSLETWPTRAGPGRFLARLLTPTESRLGEPVTFDLPFGGACLEDELGRIDEEISRPFSTRDVLSFQGPRELGRALFDALFDGPLGMRLRAESKPPEGVCIGLLIDPDEPQGRELCALPWELLYDHRSPRPAFLASSPRTPVVRHLWTTRHRPAPPTESTEPTLVFAPDPKRRRRRSPDGLDACSERAISAVQEGAAAAVAFQFVVSERAALAFGETFAQSLGRGAPIERAVTLGRQAIQTVQPETWEWAAPVLYMGDVPPVPNLSRASVSSSGRPLDDPEDRHR